MLERWQYVRVFVRLDTSRLYKQVLAWTPDFPLSVLHSKHFATMVN